MRSAALGARAPMARPRLFLTLDPDEVEAVDHFAASTPADRKWTHDFACELDAVPPDQLRLLVEEAINRHLPQDQLRVLKAYEESERTLMLELRP